MSNDFSFLIDDDEPKHGDDSRSVKQQRTTSQDYFLKGVRRIYKSSFVHSYKIKDKQLSYSSIENVFEAEVLQENAQYIDFRIHVTENNILFGLQFIPDSFKDLFLKLAEIKNTVCLRVSKRDYEIIDLLNYDELSRKWNDIKSEIDRNDALRQIKTEELQQIIEAGDTEYLTDKQIVLDEMRRLFVYRTFFGGFRQFADEVASIEYTLHSNIAPETEVPLKLALTKEVRNEDDHFLCYTIDGKNLRFNDREIKKIFRTQFKVLKESYDDYEHNYFSVVEIDTATHWLTSINCSTKEIVNDGSLTAEIICDIEDITEKEHITEKKEEEQL